MHFREPVEQLLAMMEALTEFATTTKETRSAAEVKVKLSSRKTLTSEKCFYKYHHFRTQIANINMKMGFNSVPSVCYIFNACKPLKNTHRCLPRAASYAAQVTERTSLPELT